MSGTVYMLRAAIVLATLPLAVPAWAQQQSSLFDVLRLGEVLEIMRDEGVAYGADIDADLLAGQGARAGSRPLPRSMTPGV